ncbi:MAG: sensor signal transduction histidine kinase [Phycisphaerales bacterium]|nr:sensor signal transduction histidine kinase [Phycisphaerales bacterium]
MGQSLIPSLPVSSGVPALPRSLVEALSREAGLVQILTQNLPDLIYVKDAQCRYVFNSASHLKFLGAESQEELLGKTVLDLLPGELAAKFYRDEEAIIQSGTPLVDEEEETQDYLGRRMWVSTTKVPLHDAEGRPIGLIGMSRDISERRRAEEERRRASAALAAQHAELEAALEKLRQMNDELVSAQVQVAEVTKMHSVGALAAGIVHEVKNPLAALAMGLDYLERAPAGDGVARDGVVKSMRGALENANAVVRGLLDHCRPGRLERAPLSLNVPIERALLLVRYHIMKQRVTAAVELDPDLPLVSADRTRIEQVLINVLTNALHATPVGGRIIVGTRAHDWEGGVEGGMRPGDRVVSAIVEDTGPGILPEHLGQVYKPFFTTKPAGEGTGLGLTVARSIMELHGGLIRITNRSEGGVRVTLTFKAVAEGVTTDA